MTQVPGDGKLSNAEQRLLRNLQPGDLIEVTRVERITVAQRTEHGVFPCLIDSDGNIAADLASVRVISRAPRPLADDQVRASSLPEHIGTGYLVAMLPGIGPRRGRIRSATFSTVGDYVHVVIEVPSVTGLTDVVPVALGFHPADAVTLHREPT